jgi:hypothetical protein
VPYYGKQAPVGNGSMLLFLLVPVRLLILLYDAGLTKNGLSEGKPGACPHYGEGYYGVYCRDPDGNVHLIYRGDLL